MADTDKQAGAPERKQGLPMTALIGIIVVAVAAVVGVLFMKGGNDGNQQMPPAEYPVKAKMYQLKDGSYLKLGFSVVVDSDKLPTVQRIVEKEMPGRLPAGITMILGNKSRNDLISGTYKREAFAREIKKMLEERVFGDYNKRQSSPKEMIEVREILISDFVTQVG